MATIFAIPVNNFSAKVSAHRLIGGTTVSLDSVVGLPTLTGGQWFRMSFFRTGVSGTTPLTVLKVTSVSGLNLTVTTVDGVSDAELLTDDIAEICDAAGTFSDIHSAVNALETSYPGYQIAGDIPGNAVSITGSITASQVTWPNQAANTVFAGPTTGSSSFPAFRAQVSADIPQTLNHTWITDFDTQVRTSRLDQMAAPTAAVSLNSQKITSLATPTLSTDAATKGYVDTPGAVPTWPNQSANTIFSGPTTGAAAAPTFRTQVAADLGSGTADTTKFLRGDLSWQTVAISVFGRTGAVVATSGDYSVGQVTGAAPLASPTLTGTPAAPTAAVDTNTTQLATTAYVVGQGYAKLASPALTGTPTVPTAAVGTNTTQAASTAFVTATEFSFNQATYTFCGGL